MTHCRAPTGWALRAKDCGWLSALATDSEIALGIGVSNADVCYWQKRTFEQYLALSVFWGKADNRKMSRKSAYGICHPADNRADGGRMDYIGHA